MNPNQRFKENIGNILFYYLPPKTFKQAASAGKVMASGGFFYADGVTMINYIEKGKTINE